MAVTSDYVPDHSPQTTFLPDPTALHAYLSSQYDVVGEDIHLSAQSFSILRVKDTNALLQGLAPATFAVDERLPYWAELWPSSIEMARHCLEDHSLQGKTVLELGCGLGLAGVAAARADAHVIFTDYESDALAFAQYNALMNLPRTGVDSQVEFRLLDWRSCKRVEPVDMIIGADVVYERRNFIPILNFLRHALKREGSAVFTDPDRSTGMAFFALAEQEGFDVTLGSRSLLRANKVSTILCGELHPRRHA